MTATTRTTTATITAPFRRRRGITEEAAEAAVDQACRVLRLPTIRGQVGDALIAAEKEQLSYRGFLAELLLAECDDRSRRSIRRVKAAGFPREKWLGRLRLRRQPHHQPGHHLPARRRRLGPGRSPTVSDRGPRNQVTLRMPFMRVDQTVQLGGWRR